jgi:flagellar biosynthesis protein FlhB
MTQLISKLSLIERRKLLSILQAGPLINTTTVKPRLNILSYMPIELVEKIFKYLSWKELLECRSVS